METVQSIVLSKEGLFTGTAVETTKGTITYPEFDIRTREFAAGLQERGIGPGKVVLLHMKRSIDMVVAMFGILKAGAAFAPIVYDYPQKRLKTVIRSSGASIVLEDDLYKEIAKEGLGKGEKFTPQMAAEDDTAMIIYTSGSTGTPKGVVQCQQAAGFLFTQYPYNLGSAGLDIDEFDTVVARINHGYVVAYHFEYPIAILNGKKLFLLTEEEQNLVPATTEVLRRNKSCSVPILPSQLCMYLEDEDFCSTLSSVKCFNFFAETIPDTLKKRLSEAEGFGGSVVSVYGQTEVFGIGWQDVKKGGDMVPSPGAVFKIMGDDKQILPAGQKGELLVTNPSMFREYLLEDTEKSGQEFAEKNVDIDGTRYVRTGDLAVMNEDGSITLHGRADRMVKYHGQRIELGEIENFLNNYQGIRNSIAIVVKGGGDRDILVAFYEGTKGKAVDEKILRTHMAEDLPVYMIPAAFVCLEEFPHNANGKIDYTALKNMPVKESCEHDKRELSDVEKLIAKITADILKMDEKEIYATSSLMALGMDSLNAVILISRLLDQGYRLTLSDYSCSYSLEEVASKVKRAEKKSREKKEVSSLVRCTDMQSLFAERILQVAHCFLCFRGIEEEELKNKVNELTRLHPVLRSSFIKDGDRFYTKVLKTRSARCEYEDIRDMGDGTGTATDDQKRLINDCIGKLFMNPDPADLIYVKAFRIYEEKTVLVIRMDHRVADGISERIILQDILSADVEAEADNYIEYLEYTADEEKRKKATDFWKDYLKGSEPAIMPQNSEPLGRHKLKRYLLSVPSDRAARLKEFCKKENISVSAFVFYHYGMSVMEVLGKDDIFILLGASGRSIFVDKMDRMVGCLVNAVPVRICKDFYEKDFMNSYLSADQYGFLQKEEIFSKCMELVKQEDLMPFVVSEIFPDSLVTEPYEPFDKLSFMAFNQGEFLWEDSEGIHLMMHPDVDRWDEKAYDQVFERLDKKVNGGIGIE